MLGGVASSSRPHADPLRELCQPDFRIFSRPEEKAQKPKVDWDILSVTLLSTEVKPFFSMIPFLRALTSAASERQFSTLPMASAMRQACH